MDLLFGEAWNRICTSHIKGEDSAQYVIDRSLMRPRNLLTLVNYAKSNAVNLGHQRINEDDLMKATSSYSADIGNEVGLEVRDVFPLAEDILYYFIGKTAMLQVKALREILATTPVPASDHQKLIEMLAWFAFIGVVIENNGDIQEKFIYHVHYDMKKLRILANNFTDENTMLCIHQAFYPFLEIRTQ